MYSPLFVTLMGIGTVFFGLICIIVLTTVMGSVLKSKSKPAAPAPAAAPKAAAPAAPAVNTAKEQHRFLRRGFQGRCRQPRRRSVRHRLRHFRTPLK